MEALSDKVELRSAHDKGGGRGVYARTDIPSGTLVVKEKALIAMPDDRGPEEHLHLALARSLLTHPECDSLLKAAKPLHPVTLGDLEPRLLDELRASHQQDVAALQALLTAGNSRTALSADDLLRLMLVLRFNAHYSGLYLACEMFNHACNPNCLKLVTQRTKGNAESEIRAVRAIRAGEECCISYLSPPLQSRTRRKALLEQQHFFTPAMPAPPVQQQQQQQSEPSQQAPNVQQQNVIQHEAPHQAHLHHQQQQGVQQHQGRQLPRVPPPRQRAQAPLPVPCNTFPAEMEAWRESIGDRPVQKEDELEAIESSLDAAEAALQAAEAESMAAGHAHGKTASAFARVLNDLQGVLQRGAALLHPRHVVLARAHSLLVDACTASLAASSRAQTGRDTEQSEEKQRSGCQQNGLDHALPDPVSTALLLLQAAHELRDTQDLHCGSEHHDTAKLLLDMQQALEFLLAAAPKQLYAAFPQQYGSFAKASKADYAYKQQHERISSLYM